MAFNTTMLGRGSGEGAQTTVLCLFAFRANLQTQCPFLFGEMSGSDGDLLKQVCAMVS